MPRFYRTLGSMLLGVLALWLAACTGQTQSSRAAVHDCADCPVLRAIPAGDFVPRAVANDATKAVQVRAFLMGETEVTLKQYRVFVTDAQRLMSTRCFIFQGVSDQGEAQFGWVNGANYLDPGYAQTDQSPAVCISWDDAMAYVDWLSRKTGKHYRLPSEAEFEYATRAGTHTTYYWGNDMAQVCRYANSADQSLQRLYPKFTSVAACDDGYAFTAPVGSYLPNAFGLYDMIGNAWEWTADCDHSDAEGLPQDGSAFVQSNCPQHVRRSASWFRLSAEQRSALPNADRHGNAGFRVARDF